MTYISIIAMWKIIAEFLIELLTGTPNRPSHSAPKLLSTYLGYSQQ